MAANDEVITEGPTLESLTNETLPILPAGTADEIERFIKDSGGVRRIALAFLSEPFRHMAEKLSEDHKLAQTMAATAFQLEHPCEKYAHLAEILNTARARIIIAILAAQDDGLKMLEKAGVPREAVREAFGQKNK